jgi:hypothetical protein
LARRGVVLLIAWIAIPGALVPHAASAYVRTITEHSGVPVYWPNPKCISVRANSAGSADISDGSTFTAVSASAEAWNSAVGSCSYARLVVQEPSDSAVFAFTQDGSNETAVLWIESNWQRDAQHDPAAAALTTVWYVVAAGKSNDGEIVDADVEVNGEFFSYATNGSATMTDVANTVTHELGHVLGLDHPCYVGAKPAPLPTDHTGQPVGRCATMTSQELKDVTMYTTAEPGETKKRTPEADDVAGICGPYPIANDPGTCEVRGSNGCRTAPRATDVTPWTASPWTLIVALGFLGSIWRMFRRRVRP